VNRREWEDAILEFAIDMALLLIIGVVVYTVCVAWMGGGGDPPVQIQPAVYQTQPPVEAFP